MRKDCVECGQTFARPAGLDSWKWNRRQFCGVPCANRWRAKTRNPMSDPEVRATLGAKVSAGMADWSAKKRAERRKRERHQLAQRRLAKAQKGERGRGRWYGRSCVCCQAPFLTRHVNADTCSRQCRKRQDQRLLRRRYGSTNLRARVKRAGQEYRPVDRDAIIRRDNGICQLCGQRCSGTFPSPRSLTLDHVVPLAKGGAHSPENLQVACFECNLRKGDAQGGMEGPDHEDFSPRPAGGVRAHKLNPSARHG